MSEVKWIKLNTNMFDDEKIKLIECMPDADSVLVIWIKLLIQAGKTNAGGYICLNENIPYTDEMLSTIFNRPLLTVRMALNTFKQFGMIDIDENHFISIENWEKHQNVDGLDKIREQNKIRKQKERAAKQLKLPALEVVSRDSHVTVTHGHATELELELDIESDKDIGKKKKSEKKVEYAELVKMTETEHSKLVESHGEAATQIMIEILDNYKGAKGKKYVSDYRAILSWVVKRYQQENNIFVPTQAATVKTTNPFDNMNAGE